MTPDLPRLAQQIAEKVCAALEEHTNQAPEFPAVESFGSERIAAELILAGLTEARTGSPEEAIQQFRMDELQAVMSSVDKWFKPNDARLKDNPATRAAAARELALRAIEDAAKDAIYHRECRPNRRQAEAAIADAKAMNDKWADEVVKVRTLEAQVRALTAEVAEAKSNRPQGV